MLDIERPKMPAVWYGKELCDLSSGQTQGLPVPLTNIHALALDIFERQSARIGQQQVLKVRTIRRSRERYAYETSKGGILQEPEARLVLDPKYHCTITGSDGELQEGFDEVALLDEGTEESQAGLPANSDSLIPASLVMRVSRPDKGHERREIVFTTEDGNDPEKRQAVMFAHQQGGYQSLAARSRSFSSYAASLTAT